MDQAKRVLSTPPTNTSPPPPLTAKQRADALLIICRMERRLAAFETLINAQTGKAVRA
jgi:hypothetical protein